LNRALHFYAYGIAGLTLAGGAYYGLQRLLQATPIEPPGQTTTLLRGRVVAIRPAAKAPAAPATTIPPAADPQPGSDSMVDDAEAQAQLARDRDTYAALQRNCFAAAAGNQNGDYPALQEQACSSFARFAGAHGWDTGPLPAQLAPPPDQAGGTVDADAGTATDAAAATAGATAIAVPQAADQRQVIVVDRVVPTFRLNEVRRPESNLPTGGDRRNEPPPAHPPPPPVMRGPQRPPAG
jgi:hypothetical protein